MTRSKQNCIPFKKLYLFLEQVDNIVRHIEYLSIHENTYGYALEICQQNGSHEVFEVLLQSVPTFTACSHIIQLCSF